MKRCVLALACLSLSTSVEAASIGLYSDTGASDNILFVNPQETATIYAFAVTGASDPTGGVDAGEFRIVGIPAGWVAAATPDPSLNVNLGNVFGDGVTFSWPTLQFGTFPILSIVLFATTQEEDVLVEVVKHVVPSMQWGAVLECPWLHFSCGDPCDTAGICVDGNSLMINPRGLSVEDRTWSQVRTLFR